MRVSICRYLFPAKGKTTKKKTSVVKKNLNPHFDHIFVYKGLTLEQLKDMCLELTVWDKETISSNEFLGGVCLSTGKGKIIQILSIFFMGYAILKFFALHLRELADVRLLK